MVFVLTEKWIILACWILTTTMSALQDVIEEMVETRTLINEHTPLPSPNPKKSKKSNSNEQETEVSNKSIFQAVQQFSRNLMSKMSGFKPLNPI